LALAASRAPAHGVGSGWPISAGAACAIAGRRIASVQYCIRRFFGEGLGEVGRGGIGGIGGGDVRGGGKAEVAMSGGTGLSSKEGVVRSIRGPAMGSFTDVPSEMGMSMDIVYVLSGGNVGVVDMLGARSSDAMRCSILWIIIGGSTK